MAGNGSFWRRGSSGRNVEDNFSELLFVGESLFGGLDLVEIDDPVDHRCGFGRFHPVQHAFKILVTPHGGAQNGKLFPENSIDVRVGSGARSGTAGHNTSAGTCTFQAVRPRFGADGIDDHVRSVVVRERVNFINDLLFRIENPFRGTEGGGTFEFFVGTGRDDAVSIL